MSQSNLIAGFLIVGFVVYVTVRSELSQYRAVLGI